MKKKNKGFLVMMAAVISIIGCVGGSAHSAAKTYSTARNVRMESNSIKAKECAIGTALKYAAEQLGLEVKEPGYAGCLNALINVGIIKAEELNSANKKLNKGELSLLAARIMEYRGEKDDRKRFDCIQSKKRISDLSKIKEPYKTSAVKVFGAGVMVGSSNGKYSQSREFSAQETISIGAMKSVIQKAMQKKDRSIMSPDGQLTRTTNLPKNYKRYNYILASFPNEFYELKTIFERTKYNYTPINLKDYAYNKDLNKVMYFTGRENLKFTDMYAEYGEEWLEKIRTNLEYRLNFNYKTVDNKWITKLASSYHISYNEKSNPYQIKEIKEYVKKAKANKVVVKSSKIVMEESTMYKDGGEFNVRCYVRFYIKADNIYNSNSHKQHELIFSKDEYNYFWNLKNGKWYEGIFDISVGSTAFGDSGYNFSVQTDSLIDWSEYDKKI